MQTYQSQNHSTSRSSQTASSSLSASPFSEDLRLGKSSIGNDALKVLSRQGRSALKRNFTAMGFLSVGRKASVIANHAFKTCTFTIRNYNSFARGRRIPLPSNTIVKFVPQQEAWIVERFGKFNRILDPGLAFLVPVIDKIKYVKTLKEVAVEIPSQSAITQDNVTISLDGVLYYRIIDPYKASYGVEDADFSIAQLAQTTMRSEIGQLTLDRTLAERSQLNVNIVKAINEAANAWGILCMRYEIRDIQPPEQVVKAMHSQVSAERQKRAQILDSEGSRQAAINVAEGEKQSRILSSEGFCQEQINRATGEYEAVILRAKASAETIRIVGEAIATGAGGQAVSMIVAEKYLDAFGKLAKESTTLMLPAGISEPSSMVAQAMKIYNSVNKS